MSALFPSLLWIGLPLVAIPVLIHLLNPRRQRRIRWAAMDFLLESQRRNKKWILLTQLLLLLSRMAIVALIVLMLSHLVLQDQWAQLFGRSKIHHVVLLDDSYSMSDRSDVTCAFVEAKKVVESIVERAVGASGQQQLTLLTFSDAVRLSAGQTPPFFQRPIDRSTQSELTAYLEGLAVSEGDISPLAALPTVGRLPMEEGDASLAVYLVSDFRARNFTDPAALATELSDLADLSEQIYFVQCVRESRPNLAISSLAAESGVRAAGIEMWMNLTVTNYGDVPASGATVRLQQDGHALPALALGDVPPGDEVTKRFRMRFVTDGPHWLAAELGPDAVAADNKRYFACNLHAAQPVLIITSDYNNPDARYLAVALRPSATTTTGWEPRIALPDALANPEELRDYAAVCLVDVPRLEAEELENLEAYVREGGGLAVFVGSRVEKAFYQDTLYRNGRGLLPVPLGRPTQLLHKASNPEPDLIVSDHRLFHVFAGQRNSFLPLLRVDYYYALPDGWSAREGAVTRVLAELRNRAPLVVEKPFGDGLVVAQLTKLSPERTPLGSWTNWSVNPAFPVWANELVGYLSSVRKPEEMKTVGDELQVRVPEAEYQPNIQVRVPGASDRAGDVQLDAEIENGWLTAAFGDTDRAGIYELRLEAKDGTTQREAFAINVADGEGDLAIVDRRQLAQNLDQIPFQFHYASEMDAQGPMMAGVHLSDTLLWILLALLLVEQILAYYASYHRQGTTAPR